MKKKRFTVQYKNRRKPPEIEVKFEPETKLEIIQCPAKWAHGVHPEPNVKSKKGTSRPREHERSWQS
jgi:hypothetical protein